MACSERSRAALENCPCGSSVPVLCAIFPGCWWLSFSRLHFVSTNGFPVRSHLPGCTPCSRRDCAENRGFSQLRGWALPLRYFPAVRSTFWFLLHYCRDRPCTAQKHCWASDWAPCPSFGFPS